MANQILIRELTLDQVRNLAGHDRGLAARDKFRVGELDGADEPVEVVFPEQFRQVSSSFFQGMFSESVHRLGSVEKFFGHYHFRAPAHVRAKIVDYAEQLLSRTSQ